MSTPDPQLAELADEIQKLRADLSATQAALARDGGPQPDLDDLGQSGEAGDPS